MKKEKSYMMSYYGRQSVFVVAELEIKFNYLKAKIKKYKNKIF